MRVVRTRDPIPLVVGGARNVPYLVQPSSGSSDGKEGAKRVAGEVYAVGTRAFEALNALEGVGNGRYDLVGVPLEDGTTVQGYVLRDTRMIYSHYFEGVVNSR